MFQGQGTHIALAFEVPGGWHKEKDAIVLTVLQVFTLCPCLVEMLFFSSLLLLYKKEEQNN